jgi:hypothetical protein
LLLSLSTLIQGVVETTTTATGGKVTVVRRERHLDHWDSDTLAYYLDEYPGYDLAIMFYAPWDRHSHTLAPYWDHIAEILKAGSSDSKLIMALFDCELNTAHSVMCETIHITHYPTILFIGSGPFHDTDPITRTLFGKDKSAGMMGHAPVSNTVKFQGNWQYADSILDWIRTMQALSRWHLWSTSGFGKRLRNLLFFQWKSTPTQLPVGVPSGRAGSLGSSKATTTTMGGPTPGLGTTSSLGGSEAELLVELEIWQNATEKLGKMTQRTQTFLEQVLLSGDNYTDMFALLDEHNAWTDISTHEVLYDVYRTCVLELSMDYCERASDKITESIIAPYTEELNASNKTIEEVLDGKNVTDEILAQLEQQEPYCLIIDNCIVGGMKEATCRPKTCPFKNEAACRYLTSCMDPSITNEYIEALGLGGFDTKSGTKTGTWGL